MTLVNKLYFRFRNFLAYYLPRFYHFCETRKSAVKFFLAGCFASATHLVFLAIFYDLLKWPIIWATSLAFIFSFIASFSLQKLWTFRNFSQKKAIGQFIMYIINALISLNINGVLMHLLVDRYAIWYLFSQIIVNVLIGFYNFFVYNLIVFRKKKNEINSEQKEVGASAGNVA